MISLPLLPTLPRRALPVRLLLLGATLGLLFCTAPAPARAQSAVTAAPLTYGPVHRYSFGNIPAGTANGGDLLLDSVGVAHGVLRGTGATYTGAGVQLPGGGSASAPYIDLPNGIISGSATTYPGYTSASYELWATVLSNQSWSRLFDFGTGTLGEVTTLGGTQTGTDYLMLTAAVGTTPTIQFERSNAMPGGGYVTLANANSLGTQLHVVVVYDATVGVWKCYKNGVLQSQFASLLGPDTLLDNNNWLGRSNFASDSNANAVFREFRVYDYALTDAQVLGNDQAGPDALTSPAVTTNGPFAWYRLNDAAGSTAAADSSGAGNPGALSSGTAFAATGGITTASALRFSGGSVQVPNSVALVNPTDALTVAAWIDPADWNGNRRLVQKGATNNQYRLTAENGVLKFELANPVRTVTAPLPALNVWSHVAATCDGAALRLYVNGTQVAATNATGSIPTSADPLYLGGYSPNAAATELFAGLMDDVRLYDRALPAPEINVLATALTLAAPTSTIQEGTGTGATITVTRTGNPAAALPVALSQAATAGQAALNTRFLLNPSNLALTIPAGQSSVTVTVTPLSDHAVRGTEYVTLAAAPGATYFLSGTGSATITLLDTPINVWKIAKFGGVANAQTLGDDAADPDHDGLSNLLEYALNANPLAADASGLTATGLENGKLTFTYQRPDNAPDLAYHVLWSPDLVTWTEPAATPTILSDDGTTRRLKTTLPGDGTSTRGFARLQVTRN